MGVKLTPERGEVGRLDNQTIDRQDSEDSNG